MLELHPDIPQLIPGSANLIAFRHVCCVNPYTSPHITQDEQRHLAQYIRDEYNGYLIEPYIIYYHVNKYVEDKGITPPYPHKFNTAIKPLKRQANYIFSDISDTPEQTFVEAVERTYSNVPRDAWRGLTIKEIWENSNSGTITGEQ